MRLLTSLTPQPMPRQVAVKSPVRVIYHVVK
jgi:hypothetical protein